MWIVRFALQRPYSEMPGQVFQGKVVRTSDSLSQQTRTLLAEIRASDPQQRLRPGMFASVQMRFRAPNPGILIPGDSLITMVRGEFVPVVQNGVVQMRPVHVGRDLGTQVFITAGLENGDMVVVNPNDSVKDGAHVTAKPAPSGQAGSETTAGGWGRKGRRERVPGGARPIASGRERIIFDDRSRSIFRKGAPCFAVRSAGDLFFYFLARGAVRSSAAKPGGT